MSKKKRLAEALFDHKVNVIADHLGNDGRFMKSSAVIGFITITLAACFLLFSPMVQLWGSIIVALFVVRDAFGDAVSFYKAGDILARRAGKKE